MNATVDATFYRNLYLGLQLARGRPVGPFIRRLQQRERLDRVTFDRLVDAELQGMLSYARASVPLYSTGPWSALAHGHETDLRFWPVLERGTVRAQNEQLLARRYWPGRFYRTSSATSGEPLRVAWNPFAAAWGWANEHRALLWHGVGPGTRTLLMWGSRHRLQDTLRNHRGFSTRELTPARLEQAARFLLQQQPPLCVGLPSALVVFARYVRASHPDAPKVLAPYAKVGGEQLYQFQREEIRRHLGSQVVEFYGCTEVGPIAAECPHGARHVLADNVHVEICRDSEPLPVGEMGDIVVTTLSNRAMPLVRCQIGDRGRLSAEPCSCGLRLPVLSDLVGRSSDVFLTTRGAAVHGSVIGDGLDKLLTSAPPGTVRHVLFKQLDPLQWSVLVESETGFGTPLADRLGEHIRRHFGEECQVNVERVTHVPREPSGKFRYYLKAPSALRPRDTEELTS